MNIAVLGGGQSLPEDLKKIPKCFLIGVNQHASELVRPDLIIFTDDKYHNFKTDTKTKTLQWSSKFPEFPTSGHFAAWYAGTLTKDKIYLCGFDMYESNYFHTNHEMTWGGPSNEIKTEQWERVFELSDNKNYVAVSGPLTFIL